MEQYVQSTMTHPFWSWFIIVGTVGGILGCIWLVRWMSSPGTTKQGEKAETMGHVWDETLQEYNNPLPSWWLWMFYITLIFGIVYLVLYPGLGAFGGVLKWTSTNQYQAEMDTADAKYGPLYEAYKDKPIDVVAKDDKAVLMGQRLYQTYCTVCHGSDATGAGQGYPNLRDNDWLWGGTPEAIYESIANGRISAGMVAWSDALGGDAGVKDMVEYVLKLNNRPHNEEAAARAQNNFMICAGCHGMDGTGNPMLGAPNLTNNIWLYGGSPERIFESISKGRNGVMPAHKNFLGEAKTRLLAAYVYSLGGASVAQTEAAPALEAAVTAVEEAASAVVEEAGTAVGEVMEEAPTVMEEAATAVEDAAAAVVEGATAVVEEAATVIEDAAAAVEEAMEATPEEAPQQ
jgi:cytochrome c oxidase cbb3-type subunit III